MRYVLLFFMGINVLFSQAFVDNNHLIIQGIARDADNFPRANESELALTFELYYYSSANTKTTIISEDDRVETDAFGVFKYELAIPNSAYQTIGTFPVYMSVSDGSIVYSDEKINTAPYAIYAQNGVPTGSIIAYSGAEDDLPSGWLLCDGQSFPDNEIYANLKKFLDGTKVPDLRGQFLRGTGTYINDANKSGPNLNDFQEDEIKNHTHTVSITTLPAGAHSHQLKNSSWHEGNDGIHYLIGAKRNGANNTTSSVLEGATAPVYLSGVLLIPSIGYRISVAGNHQHTFDGEVVGVGGAETRPDNYGVNFIIKI